MSERQKKVDKIIKAKQLNEKYKYLLSNCFLGFIRR